jgi:hypothetical protein
VSPQGVIGYGPAAVKRDEIPESSHCPGMWDGKARKSRKNSKSEDLPVYVLRNSSWIGLSIKLGCNPPSISWRVFLLYGKNTDKNDKH